LEEILPGVEWGQHVKVVVERDVLTLEVVNAKEVIVNHQVQ
jgi:hypothetical protein